MIHNVSYVFYIICTPYCWLYQVTTCILCSCPDMLPLVFLQIVSIMVQLLRIFTWYVWDHGLIHQCFMLGITWWTKDQNKTYQSCPSDFQRFLTSNCRMGAYHKRLALVHCWLQLIRNQAHKVEKFKYRKISQSNSRVLQNECSSKNAVHILPIEVELSLAWIVSDRSHYVLKEAGEYTCEWQAKVEGWCRGAKHAM